MTDIRDNIGKTAKARFNAHRRLSNHNVKSMLVVILYSTVLLLTSIVDLSNLDNSGNVQVINKLIPITLSLVILIYSSIIFFANYSVRAERFHQCGLELNNLARKYDILLESESVDEIKINHAYNNILKRYENHAYVDYIKGKDNKGSKYYFRTMYDNASYIVLAICLLSYSYLFIVSIY